MISEKIHVYFMPGLAAGTEIFRNIALPSETFECHFLAWLIPKKKETLAHYAERMAKEIKHNEIVLVGVSFGGVMVQEMKPFLTLKKLIIISSVKSRRELPLRLRFARVTRLYKMVPTGLVLSTGDLTKYAVGPRSRKRLQMYNEYLHVRDKRYLDWAIKQMVCWSRAQPDEGVVHLHGDADVVFPIDNIKDCIQIRGGTHVMILLKATQISEKITEIILDN